MGEMPKSIHKIKTEYSDKEFINYAKKNIKSLIEGKRNSQLSELFYVKTKERERCRKIPFIIYWLIAEKGKFWTGNNFRNSYEGKAKLKKENVNEILKVIDELRKDPIIDNFFKDRYFEYYDLRKILSRYQKERNAIVERKILESIKNSPRIAKNVTDHIFTLSSTLSNYSSEIIANSLTELKKYYELKFEVLDHIESEGTVIQSEMRRKKRRFQRINKELLEKIICELEEEGRISIKIYSGRTFLNYRE